jgi:D-alanyl-D-alanine carboxypeptidase
MQERLDRLVEAEFPGAFVYVEDPDGRSAFFTAGVADVTTRRRMAPDDRYRVGSTTKTFTAVVVLQLVAEGKLALDQTAHDWLPELQIPNGRALTIEHLLRMRSGLFDFEDDPSLLGNLAAHLRPLSLATAIHLGIGHPPEFPPGARFAYCNTNFCLLEAIIERVTGRFLAHEFEHRVFEPLSLADSSYPDEADLTLPEPYIRGYDRTADGWRDCSQVFFGRGDGALVSSARDLARFFRALLVDRVVLPATLLAAMMHVVPDDPPAAEHYGLGLLAEALPCGTAWGHAGGGFGYLNFPYVHLETGRFAVCMVNGSYSYRHAADASAAGRERSIEEIRATAYCDRA